MESQLATQYKKPQVEGMAEHLLTMVAALLAVVMHGWPSITLAGSYSRFSGYITAAWPV
jgi:hypothetical protein